MKKNITIALLGLLPILAFADPTTDLAKAVKEHNIEAMKTAIAAGADVNAFDENGNPPLNCAVWFPDAVQLLIDAKADVNLKNPLISAVTWGESVSSDLLMKAGANVNVTDPLGHSVLWIAAFNGNQASILTSLLDAGADPNFKDKDGVSPMIVLAMTGKSPSERVTTIKSQAPYLEKAGLVLTDRLKNPKESDYSTIGEMMTALINGKADINARATGTEMTALMWAAKNNRADAVQALIDNKADLNLKSSVNMTALGYACETKKGSEAALLLIDSGMQLNDTFYYQFNLYSLKSKRKVDVELKNSTAMMIAASLGKADLIQKFIDAKANIDIVAGDRGSKQTGWALYNVGGIAEEYGQSAIVSMLIKAGIKPVER